MPLLKELDSKVHVTCTKAENKVVVVGVLLWCVF